MSESESPGPALRAARERLGMSVREVAITLKVPSAVVSKIEDEQYDALPARVFTRAYLRGYAELVGLDPRALLWAYDRNVDPDETERVENRRLGAVRGMMAAFVRDLKLTRWHSWIFGGTVVLFIALAGLFLWFAWSSDAPAASAPAEPNQAAAGEAARPAASADDAVADVALVPVSNARPANDSFARSETPVSDSAPVPASDSFSSDPPSNASPDEPQAVPSNGAEEGLVVLSNPLTYVPGDEHVLAFRFTQDCWVEVTDASGAPLHGDLERAGDRLEVRGEAPFTITLGYAPGVQLAYNGEQVMLDQHTNDNDVAGLVIGL